jgi:hypothetical protein
MAVNAQNPPTVAWIAATVQDTTALFVGAAFLFTLSPANAALTVLDLATGSLNQWMYLPTPVGAYSGAGVACGDTLILAAAEGVMVVSGWPSTAKTTPYANAQPGLTVCLAPYAGSGLHAVYAIATGNVNGYGSWQIMLMDATTGASMCSATRPEYQNVYNLNVVASTNYSPVFDGFFVALTNGDIIFVSRALSAPGNCTITKWATGTNGVSSMSTTPRGVAGRPCLILQLEGGVVRFMTGPGQTALTFGPSVFAQDGSAAWASKSELGHRRAVVRLSAGVPERGPWRRERSCRRRAPWDPSALVVRRPALQPRRQCRWDQRRD